MDQESNSDIETTLKSLFQEVSFGERDKMTAFYKSSTKPISISLLNEEMLRGIEDGFVAKMDEYVKKNDLYVAIAYGDQLTECYASTARTSQ